MTDLPTLEAALFQKELDTLAAKLAPLVQGIRDVLAEYGDSNGNIAVTPAPTADHNATGGGLLRDIAAIPVSITFTSRDEAVDALVRRVFGAEPVYADQSVANKPVEVSTLETHACDTPPPPNNATRDEILFHLDRIINQGADSDVRSGYHPDALWLEEARQMIFTLEHDRRQLHTQLDHASTHVVNTSLRNRIDALLRIIEPS